MYGWLCYSALVLFCESDSISVTPCLITYLITVLIKYLTEQLLCSPYLQVSFITQLPSPLQSRTVPLTISKSVRFPDASLRAPLPANNTMRAQLTIDISRARRVPLGMADAGSQNNIMLQLGPEIYFWKKLVVALQWK